MSIKVFFDLLFNYICVKKVSFTVKLTFVNGDESVHTVNVDNSVCEVDVLKDIDKVSVQSDNETEKETKNGRKYKVAKGDT